MGSNGRRTTVRTERAAQRRLEGRGSAGTKLRALHHLLHRPAPVRAVGVVLDDQSVGVIEEGHRREDGQVLAELAVQGRLAVVDAVGWDGTVAGEAVDLHREGSRLDFDTLEFIHSRKTGALFVASAAAGGMLANIHPAPLQRIEVFAKNLGLTFQITDDVLDVTSTSETLGKDVGKDEQRLTFVKLAGVDGARKLSEELVDTSLAAIDPPAKTRRTSGGGLPDHGRLRTRVMHDVGLRRP